MLPRIFALNFVVRLDRRVTRAIFSRCPVVPSHEAQQRQFVHRKMPEETRLSSAARSVPERDLVGREAPEDLLLRHPLVLHKVLLQHASQSALAPLVCGAILQDINIVVRGRRKPSAMPGADTPPGAVIVNPRFTESSRP